MLCVCASALADGFIHIVPPPWHPHPRPMPRPVIVPLSVKYHTVEVKVKEQLAVTSIDQEFFNPNDRELEGIYMFPVPRGVTINRFSMYIDGKEQQAELLDAKKARKIYEDIVRQMKDPALLEYADQKLFKLRIYPIPARSTKRVKLSYSEILRSDAGLCRYVYPLNTEKFSSTPLERVGVKVSISSKTPIKNVYCPSHKAEVIRKSDHEATVGYEAKNVRPDKDLIVYYSLDTKDFGMSLLNYQEEGEAGYFMLLVSPKQEFEVRDVESKEITFVLDASGSMSGEKIEQAKKSLTFCVNSLDDRDTFNLIRFSTEVEPLFQKPVQATKANRRKALEFVKDLRAMGGTAINDALAAALAQAGSGDRPHAVVFLTDGKPTIGEQDTGAIVKRVKEKMEKTRVFCFGVGTEVNTHLLDKITETARGASQYVLPDEDIEVKVSSFYTKIKSPVLTDLKLSFSSAKVSQVYPRVMPDLFVGSQLVVTGRYRSSGPSAIILTGTRRGRRAEYVYEADLKPSKEDDSVARIWASRKVAFLLDEIRLRGENNELKDEVVKLAKKWGIITPYTSYLVLEDEEKRVRLGRRRDRGDILLPQAAMERESGAFEDSVMHYEALKGADSGAGGLTVARGMGNAKMAASPAAPAEGFRFRDKEGKEVKLAEQIKTVGAKTFYFNGTIWVDSVYQIEKPAKKTEVKYLSDEYFRLLDADPLFGRYLAVGKNVIVCVGGTAYEITK